MNGTLVKSFIKGSGGGGGDIGTGAYNVKVIDYDGTIIAEKNLDEGKTFKLPKAPSHEGLVFQGWSATQEIVNGKITVGKNDVMIGAIYTTASGKNEFDIELNAVTGLEVTLNLDGDKDWGDGTTDSLTSHTYSQVGKYTIKTDGTEMTTSSSSGLFGQDSSNNNYYCTSARIATIEDITSYAFFYCRSLKTVILSNSVKHLSFQSFYYTSSLEGVIIPSSVTEYVGNSGNLFDGNYSLRYCLIPKGWTLTPPYMFNSCVHLLYCVIPEGITTINSNMFASCYNFIAKVKIPKSVSTIQNGAFRYKHSVCEYDFSEHTSVPTLANTLAFGSINQLSKIKVPSALYDSWKGETNWATYADYIVAV